ncbi:MAG TPA: hypothetical protein VNV65_08645 [Candidatus Solibacter sp.]|nr:hypothetical protein [Candidatus Solibacter sp.]
MSATSSHHDAVPGRRAVIALLVVATVLVVGFWVVWFFVDRSLLAMETRPAYIEHEQSFVLADGWLALCTAAAALALWRRHASAFFWLVAGGGAGLFLGSMDALYDISRNDWFATGGAGYTELGIVVLTWGLSIGLMAWAWRRRRGLLDPGGPPA